MPGPTTRRLRTVLPIGLLVLAVGTLGVLGIRAVRAERALAERMARTELTGRAREAAGHLAGAAAGLARDAATGEDAAVLSSEGVFLRPVEPVPLRRLAPDPARDAEGAYYLGLAERAETVDDDPARAEEIYGLVVKRGLVEEHVVLALHRLLCLQRRLGREYDAERTRQALVAALTPEQSTTLEGLLARSSSRDPALATDLLNALGSGDDIVVLRMLEDAGLADPAALASRRAELSRIARLRGLLSTTYLETPSGVRLVSDHILAWSRGEDGSFRLMDGPVPILPADTDLLSPGEDVIREGRLVEIVPLVDMLPDLRVAAWTEVATVDADATRRAWIVGALLALLLAGGGTAVLLTLRAARREADAGRARSDFLARVGHDLRTPVARVRLFAETLADGKLTDPDEVIQFAAVIERDAERLSSLVGKVLDLTRQDRGREALRTDAVDLARLVRDVANAHGSLLDRAGMRLDLTSTEDGVTVVGDEDALRGAIGNLIENALRHAADGGIVDVTVVAGNGEAEVRVEDRGPGLPIELGDRVFDRFVRGPDAGAPGAGLGLALVREVVAGHGGCVTAGAREGGGASLAIRLPLSEGEE
jgi:signal transduction histidine kinase